MIDEQREMVSVRKDILDKLLNAIDEEIDRSERGDGIYLGDIICGKDELLSGITYDELSLQNKEDSNGNH
jgi:hypothetical protein